MEKERYMNYKLRKVVILYIHCLELFCQSANQKDKNPVLLLVVTKKLVSINQELKEIASQIAKTQK